MRNFVILINVVNSFPIYDCLLLFFIIDKIDSSVSTPSLPFFSSSSPNAFGAFLPNEPISSFSFKTSSKSSAPVSRTRTAAPPSETLSTLSSSSYRAFHCLERRSSRSSTFRCWTALRTQRQILPSKSNPAPRPPPSLTAMTQIRTSTLLRSARWIKRKSVFSSPKA